MEVLVMSLVVLCSILLFAWVESALTNIKNAKENEITKRAFELSTRGYYNPNSYSENGKVVHNTQKKSSPFTAFILIVIMCTLMYLGLTTEVESDVKTDNSKKIEQLDNQF